MAKRKKKKFQKKQFLSLFEKKNYQKLISKAKQFEIEGMSADELHTILSVSYQNLAQSNFEKGDIIRAIRDIDSLLQIDNNAKYKLIKLKYLCYIEHFQDAVELGEELISLKNLKKIQKEALFLYLIARLYTGDYELDKKQLKSIPISRQKYILGFKALMQENKILALDYFNKCNPRAKIEKENIKAVIEIISGDEVVVSLSSIKPLYQFLITGESNGVANSKNFREIRKEVIANFSKIEKNADMQNLLTLKKSIPIETILKNIQDKKQVSRLIYNNIVLLVDKREYRNALRIFIKYRNSLVKITESASLFIEIKNQIEDNKSDTILINFFSSYLKLHHKKIASHQIDYMLLFLIQRGEMRKSIDLAKEYGRDNIIFFLKELPLMREFNPYYQTSFNKALKKHSIFTDTLIKLMIQNIESTDEELYDLSKEEEKIFLGRLYILSILLQNLGNPHRKYKDSLFKLFKVLALVIQSFSYSEQESIYLKLSVVIEQYIGYFKVDRFNLPIDIKALFVSISKKESVKKDNIYDEEEEGNYFYLAKKILFEDEDIYDFDIVEYDLSIIKERCLRAIERGDDEPFKILGELNKVEYYEFKIPILLEFLEEVIKRKLHIILSIQSMLFYLQIDLYNSSTRDSLLSHINNYAKTDIDASKTLIEYAVTSVVPTSRGYVWYLKWIDGYLTLIDKYGLEKDDTFIYYREVFLSIQEKRKFKSLNAKYKKIKKFKVKEGVTL